MSRALWMCSGVLALELLTQCAVRPAGTDGAPTPEEAVASYNAAVHAGDGERVARFMAPESRRELVIDVLTEITNVLHAVSPERGSQGRAAVSSIRVSSDNAAADAAGEAVRLERLDGRWYVAHSPVWYLPHHPERSENARP